MSIQKINQNSNIYGEYYSKTASQNTDSDVNFDELFIKIMGQSSQHKKMPPPMPSLSMMEEDLTSVEASSDSNSTDVTAMKELLSKIKSIMSSSEYQEAQSAEASGQELSDAQVELLTKLQEYIKEYGEYVHNTKNTSAEAMAGMQGMSPMMIPPPPPSLEKIEEDIKIAKTNGTSTTNNSITNTVA